MPGLRHEITVEIALGQGRLADAREKLLRLLSRRFSVPAAIREQVEGCGDKSKVDIWFDRAITAESLDEVFAELLRS